MTKIKNFDQEEIDYCSSLETETLLKYKDETGSLKHRWSRIDVVTQVFFSFSSLLTVVFSIMTILFYMLFESWIVILIGSVLLVIPVCGLILFGGNVLRNLNGAKMKNKIIIAELEKRNK